MLQYGGNECRITNKLDSFKEQISFRKISGLTVKDMQVSNYNNWCSIILSNIKKSFKKALHKKEDEKTCNFFKFYQISNERFENFKTENELEIIKKINFTHEMYQDLKIDNDSKSKFFKLFDNKISKIDYTFPKKENLIENVGGVNVFSPRERNFLCEDFIGIIDEYIDKFISDPINFLEENFLEELGEDDFYNLVGEDYTELIDVVSNFTLMFSLRFREYFLKKSYHYFIVKNQNNEIKTLLVKGVLEDYKDDNSEIKELYESIENLNSNDFFKNLLNEDDTGDNENEGNDIEGNKNEGNKSENQGDVIEGKNNVQKGGMELNPLYYVKKGINKSVEFVETNTIRIMKNVFNKHILKKENIDFIVKKIIFTINRFFKICILKIFPVSPLLNLSENHNLDNYKNEIKILKIEKESIFNKKNMLNNVKNLHKNIFFKQNDEIIIDNSKNISKITKKNNLDSNVSYLVVEINTIKKTFLGDYDITGIIKGMNNQNIEIFKSENKSIKISPKNIKYYFTELKIKNFIQKFNYIRTFFDIKRKNKNYFQLRYFSINKKLQNLEEEIYNLTMDIINLKKVINPKVITEIGNRKISLKKKEIEKENLEKKIEKLKIKFEKEKDLVMNILTLLLKSENLHKSLLFFSEKNQSFTEIEELNSILKLFENGKDKDNFFSKLGHVKYSILSKLKITDDEIITKLDYLIKKTIDEIDEIEAEINTNNSYIQNLKYNYLSENFLYSTTCYSNYDECNYIKFFNYNKNKNNEFKPKNIIESGKEKYFKELNHLNQKQLNYLINLENSEDPLKFSGKICSNVCSPANFNYLKSKLIDHCDAIIQKINGEYKLLGKKKNMKIEILKLQNKIEELKNKKSQNKDDNDDNSEIEKIQDIKKKIEELQSPLLQKTIDPHKLGFYNKNDEIIFNEGGIKSFGKIIKKYKIKNTDSNSDSENVFDIALNNYIDIGKQNKQFWKKNSTYEKGDYIFIEKNFLHLNYQNSTEKYIATEKIENSMFEPFITGNNDNDWINDKIYMSGEIMSSDKLFVIDEKNTKKKIYFKCLKKHISVEDNINNYDLILKEIKNKYEKYSTDFDKEKSNNQINVSNPIHEPIQNPIQEPIQEPIQNPIQEPVQEPVQNPIQGNNQESNNKKTIISEKLKISKIEFIFNELLQLKDKYWKPISIGKEPWQYIKDGKKIVKNVKLDQIEKQEYVLKFPCNSCENNNLVFHFNVIEFYYNLISPYLISYKNKLKNNSLNDELELMFYNPITQNRFSRVELKHVEKIFIDSLNELKTKPPPKTFKEKIIANASLKNLNSFNELLTIGTIFNPALGQMKGVSLLMKTISKLNLINRTYKDFSELYKLYVSEKDSTVNKKDRWLKTANHLLGLAGSSRSVGLINYKNIDLIENVIPPQLEEAMNLPFIGDTLSDALHMDKLQQFRSTESIIKNTNSALFKGYGVLFTKFVEKKDNFFEDLFSLKLNFDIYNTHNLNSKLFLDFEKNGGTLEDALFKISYLKTNFKDTTKNFEICNCYDKKPIFSKNDKYSLRVIKPSKVLSYLNKYLGDSSNIMNKTLHWYIDIETTDNSKEPCIFSLGYKYNFSKKNTKVGLKITSLESPDTKLDLCNKSYKQNQDDQDFLTNLQEQKNCVVGEIFKNKENKYFYRGRTAKNSKGEKYEGNLNVSQIQLLNWFLNEKGDDKFIEEINSKTGNKIFHKNLPFTFFWSPHNTFVDKFTKWSNDEMLSSESFALKFHLEPEKLIKKIYDLENK